MAVGLADSRSFPVLRMGDSLPMAVALSHGSLGELRCRAATGQVRPQHRIHGVQVQHLALGVFHHNVRLGSEPTMKLGLPRSPLTMTTPMVTNALIDTISGAVFDGGPRCGTVQLETALIMPK